MAILAKYRGPWQGVDVSKPENIIDPAASSFIQNFILRNGEIRTRPSLDLNNPNRSVPVRTNPNTFSQVIYEIASYINTSLNHVLQAHGNNKLYTFTYPGTWGAVLYASGDTLGGATQGISINGVYYFPTNATGTIEPQITSFTGGNYITEIASHLIVGYTTEANVSFPYRVRWSASGNFAQFDPSLDPTAGFNNLNDISDFITGISSNGKSVFIFRNNGITEMIPTGQGTNPFDFVNFSSASNDGIGCFYATTLASNGSEMFFIAEWDVMSLGPNGLRPIGGRARDAIWADLVNANAAAIQNDQFKNTNSAQIIGSFISILTDGYNYPCYIITIPQGISPNVRTVFWLYSIEEGSWTRFVWNNNWVTSKIAYSQYQYTDPVTGQVFTKGYPILGALTSGSGAGAGMNGYITHMDATNAAYDQGNGKLSYDAFNTQDDATYTFRVEEFDLYKKPTVRRLAVVYRDLGKVKVTFTITGDKGTALQSKTVTLGTDFADGKLKTELVPIVASSSLMQLSMTRNAGDGPLSIAGIDVIGDGVDSDTL